MSAQTVVVPSAPGDARPAAATVGASPATAGGAAERRRPHSTRDDGVASIARDVPVPPAVVPAEDPAAWCGAIVRAAVEALTGSRPTAQLGRWLTADLYDELARRAGLTMRIKGRPMVRRQAVVRRVHVCRLGALVAEAAVVVHDGERVRAAAVRVEAHRGRWRATALDIC
jgi:hypothetical protein